MRIALVFMLCVLCLYVGPIYGTSIWDCVKTAPVTPVARSMVPESATPESTPESVAGDFWSVVVPVAPVVPNDEKIVETISTEISQKAGEGINIRVECDNGVVTISGTVSDDAQSQKISWIVQSTTGVKNVINNIVVKKEEVVSGDQVLQPVKPVTKAQTPRRILRPRTWRSGCANGACSR